MLDDKKYVVQSLELHLFFSRIMKEHAIFLKAGFTPKDADYAKEADNYKQQFEEILMNAVQLSNGIISDDILSSGEIVTDFTLDTEQKTQDFTGISIDQKITMLEMQLNGGNNLKWSPDLVEYIRQLNDVTKTAVGSLIAFKERVLNNTLSCKMFTVNYPLLIDHIIREAKQYQSLITHLDNGYSLEDSDIRQNELFWDQIMMEHALFIRGLLDPSEGVLINTANNFASDYTKLLESTKNATNMAIDSITNETLRKTV